MRVATALFISLMLAIGAEVNAASFDCAKASSRIDNAICASATVSNLDNELDTAYRSALARSTDPEGVRTAQRAWLKQTRNQCQDEQCLVTVYSERRKALDASPPNPQVASVSSDMAPTATPPTGHSSSPEVVKVLGEKASTSDAVPAKPVMKAVLPPSGGSSRITTAVTNTSEAKAGGPARSAEAVSSILLVLGLLASVAVPWFVYRKRKTAGAGEVWASVLALSSLVGVLLIFIVALGMTAANPGLHEPESVAATEQRLIGKWISDSKYAPTCPWVMGSTVYFHLLPGGKSAIQDGLGKIGSYGTWRTIRAYDGDLAVVEHINQNGETYYYVNKLIDPSTRMQSIVLHVAPDSREAAEVALKKTELFAGIELGSSAMYRCAQESVEVPQSVSGDVVVQKMYAMASEGEWGQSEFRRLPQVRSVEMTLLHYMYDNQYEDQRCKDALTNMLRHSINDIGRVSRMSRQDGRSGSRFTDQAHEIATQAQAAVQRAGCRWWIL